MYEPISLPRLERVTRDGVRYYLTPEGKQYPSVTTVLSILSNESIQAWKDSIGEEEAARVSARAANRGTRIHSLCENFILGNDLDVHMLDREMWNSLKPLVSKIGKVLALEAPLYSDYLKVAGTVDCVGYWNGKLSIIDFKTSGRLKTKDEIHSYYIQEAAYAVCFEEQTDIPITQLVTIMAVDDESPLVFVEHRDKWIGEFMKVRKEYSERFGV